jgi:hypothetical protein
MKLSQLLEEAFNIRRLMLKFQQLASDVDIDVKLTKHDEQDDKTQLRYFEANGEPFVACFYWVSEDPTDGAPNDIWVAPYTNGDPHDINNFSHSNAGHFSNAEGLVKTVKLMLTVDRSQRHESD